VGCSSRRIAAGRRERFFQLCRAIFSRKPQMPRLLNGNCPAPTPLQTPIEPAMETRGSWGENTSRKIVRKKEARSSATFYSQTKNRTARWAMATIAKQKRAGAVSLPTKCVCQVWGSLKTKNSTGAYARSEGKVGYGKNGQTGNIEIKWTPRKPSERALKSQKEEERLLYCAT